jgi:hypothetical protein
MEHIKQKSLADGREVDIYTVVVTDDWTLPLSEHPSVLEHPELFEVVNQEIPENHQFLRYTG